MNDLYGGTVRLFNEIKTLSQGIEVTYVDMTDMQNVLEAKTDKTKMIFVETPTNPCLLYTSPSPRDFEASRMPSSA